MENEKGKQNEETTNTNDTKDASFKKEGENNLGNSTNESEKKEETKYEFKIPDGININKELLSKYESIVKEYSIKPEVAQKIIDIEAEIIKNNESEIIKAREEWKKETLKELGNNAEVEIKYAQKAVEKFGDDELVKLLDETGLGNRKEVIKIFAKIGKAISEDTLSEGKNGITQDKTLEERLYPKAK